MFRSMISSRKMTVFFIPSLPETSLGSSTMRGRTEGTCTTAKSGREVPSSFFFFFSSTLVRGFTSFLRRIKAAMFRERFRTNGKGREESTAMGVNTG